VQLCNGNNILLQINVLFTFSIKLWFDDTKDCGIDF